MLLCSSGRLRVLVLAQVLEVGALLHRLQAHHRVANLLCPPYSKSDDQNPILRGIFSDCMHTTHTAMLAQAALILLQASSTNLLEQVCHIKVAIHDVILASLIHDHECASNNFACSKPWRRITDIRPLAPSG